MELIGFFLDKKFLVLCTWIGFIIGFAIPYVTGIIVIMSKLGKIR